MKTHGGDHFLRTFMSGLTEREPELGQACCQNAHGGSFDVGPKDRFTSGYLIKTRTLKPSTTLKVAVESKLSFAGRSPVVVGLWGTATTGRIQLGWW
jgi:hypothetical protein